MLVQFLRDFQGRATNEIFYQEGQQVDLPDEIAFACFAEDAAALVEADDEEEDAAPAPKRGRPRRA